MNKKLGRLLQPNMRLYFIALYGFSVVTLAARQYTLAALEVIVASALLVFYEMKRARRRQELQKYVQEATASEGIANQGELPFPVVLVRMGDGNIVWTNAKFESISGYRDTMREQKIDEFLPGFSTDWLSVGKNEYPFDVTMKKRRYRIYGSVIRTDDPDSTMLGVLYFSDLTELYQIRDEYVRSRPVVSIILIDNYEELTKNLSEAAISTLNAGLNDVITAWTDGYHGLLRRLERTRFLFIFEKRDLTEAVDGKFSILDDIRRVTNPAGLPATISMGLGLDAATFEEGYNFASLSIDMALSRGGDQAVIKDRLNFTFYGGRTTETDHSSKVRSRVTSNSLMKLIGQSSQIFIMGHRNADLDAFGAAMGVKCMCRKKGKRAYIVLDKEHNAVGRFLDEVLKDPEYKDTFISGQDALLLADSHSILVVVDTNRPDQVESKPLLESIPKVCVIDHHRRAADYITPVVVNFHEPFASSASELVTELLQYGVENKDILPVEVKGLLAGICMDTKSFNVRTSERTFEAAAYLRRLGADPVEVKKLLQNDFQNTLAKYEIIKSARMYREQIAVAALETKTSRTLAAQAADELLNISGITASFVLYPDDDRVIISARSIGDANVQMILEPLGGGGNAATAGAQVKDSTLKETVDALVASIDKFYED